LDFEHFLLGFSATEFLHYGIDVVACVVGIRPLFKVEGKLELLLTNLEYLSDLCLSIKSDRVRNLSTRFSSSFNFNHFIVFNDLIEVIMECFTNFSELFASIVFLAEGKDLPSSVVIELQ
jgi:hypothetical protein